VVDAVKEGGVLSGCCTLVFRADRDVECCVEGRKVDMSWWL